MKGTQETAIVPSAETTTAIPEPTADLIKNSFPQSPTRYLFFPSTTPLKHPNPPDCPLSKPDITDFRIHPQSIIRNALKLRLGKGFDRQAPLLDGNMANHTGKGLTPRRLLSYIIHLLLLPRTTTREPRTRTSPSVPPIERHDRP